MVFLSAAGAGIVRTLVGYTIEPVAHRVGYITRYNSKVQKLRTDVEDLVAAREGLQHEIDQALRMGKRVQDSVELWMKRVDEIIGKANVYLEDERHTKMKCLCGLCPNPILRYKLGRKSTKLGDEVVKIYAEKEFPSVSYCVPPQDVCSISTRENTSSDSRLLTLKEIMHELRNPDTEIILVSGIGGVGKTTLAQDVLKKAIDNKLFDDVVMVQDLKENPDLGRIQKEIATKLGMEVDTNQTVHERAPSLCERIKDKKTLVILDDVWEALDLVAMGIPRVVTCKILLTCRSRKILSLDFRDQKVFPLDILGEEDAWRLFEKMAGNIVKEDHHIRNIAIQVAKRCGGLPVLLVTVASSLKYRTTLPPWKDTLRRLKEIANEKLTRKEYLSLEWSYNQLDEEVKPLFLLCGITLTRNSVNLSDLLKYGMGLGLFRSVETVEEARNSLHSSVEKLKDFCLLLDGDTDTYVRMHDLVRDVSLTIAARDAHALSVASEGELKEWPPYDVLENCKSICLHNCHIPRLPEVLQCPNLELFVLGKTSNGVTQFPCHFFQEVIKLRVLDLTGMSLIPSLPRSLQFLKNLHTLCLDDCDLGDVSLVGQLGSLEILSFLKSKVKCLPKEIGQLTRLRLLDMTNCHDLEVISPNVIASLKMLEDLRMRNSFNKWEDERVVGERTNANLSDLKHLSHLTSLQIHIPYVNSLPADLFSNMNLETYHVCIGESHFVWRDMLYQILTSTTVNTLILKLSISNYLKRGLQMLLEKCEVLRLDGRGGTNEEDFSQKTHLYIIKSNVQLSTLTILEVDCYNGKFLLSSSTARSLIQLKHLRIWKCPLLEGIVSRKECDEENGRAIMFPKLEHFELICLPNLSRFCSGNYIEFPSLQKLELVDCPKLGEFISNPVLYENNIVCNENAVVDSGNKCSVDDNISVSLFDGKVRLPRLKILYIDGLPKLATIWLNQLPQENDFQNLNSVDIQNCDSLRYVFPASLVVRGLQQLKKLKVWNCGEMEEIVAKEEGVKSTPTEFVFPKVTYMEFWGLPKVRNFYPGIHLIKVPLLKHLEVAYIGAEENLEDHQSTAEGFISQLGKFEIARWEGLV